MDHDHAEQALLRRLVEQRAEPVRLVLAEKAVGHEGRGGARRRHADQRHLAAHAQIGKGVAVGRRVQAVARHPGAPGAADLVEGARHIGVVIARHDRNILGRAQRLQPEPRQLDLAVERQIDEVAGDGEMVDAGRLDVGDDRAEHAVMHDVAAVALPVDVADHALGREVAIGYIGKRTEMDIGNMREPEHHAFLGYAAGAFHPRDRRRNCIVTQARRPPIRSGRPAGRACAPGCFISISC